MKYLFTALIAGMSFFAMAQTYSLDNVGRYNVRNAGTIVDGNIIKGYYFFYESEKVSGKTRAFEIVVLDENLKEVASERIIETKTTYLMEATYNGTAVLFKFYNTKSKEIAYRALSNDGKLSSKETRLANKAEISIYSNSVAKDLQNTNLYNFGSDLFVDVVIYKDKKYTYQVQALDNNGGLAWEYKPEVSKGILTGGFLASNSDLLILVEAESPKTMSRDYTFNLKVLNNKGEEEFAIDMANNKYNLLPQNAHIDAEKDVIVVMGEYYNGTDKSMKSESLGLFVKTFSLDGEEIEENFLSWSKHIYSSLPSSQRKEAGEHYTYFHSVIKTDDGRILAIGEQYRKQVSAVGVAFNVLAAASGGSTDASSMEIKLGNMVIVELDEKYELSAVEYYEKTPNRVILEQGYGLVNQHLLAKLLKVTGSFDYAFMMNNEDNSIITFAFYDREKEEGKIGKNFVLNFINYDSETHSYSKDKIELRSKGVSTVVMPGKPGNVVLIRYNSKEKVIEVTMEPINI